MIPLITPEFPPARDIAKIYSRCYATGTHSNFGELFYEAVKFLSDKSKRECLPVSTGTAAIEIACRMQFPPNSRVLVPDYTHAGTLQAIVAAECDPVLVETDPYSWTITADSIIKNASHVRGIVAVSPFGYPVDVKAIDRASRLTGLPVVYDFAGAWGEFPDTPSPVCYSLHATKNFSCGEGGIISLKTRGEWERARWFSNFCNDPDRVVRSLKGRNHKPSELLCAVILAHKNTYDNILINAELKAGVIVEYAVELNMSAPMGGSPSLCVLEGLTAQEAKQLSLKEIETKQYYPPFPDSTDFCRSISRTESSAVLARYALPFRGYKEVIKCLKALKKKPRKSLS